MKESMINIFALPDLLRNTQAFPEGIFDLIREPIRQGAGLDLGFAPFSQRHHCLAPSFDLEKFRTMAGVDIASEAKQDQWRSAYYSLPEEALDYLFVHFPVGYMLLSFEMPPWLSGACRVRGVDFIDIRPSPLRFARDLYIALRWSNAALFQRLSPFTVLEEEIRLEASILSSNVRMHQRRMKDERGLLFDELNGSMMFIGQAPYDASLLADNGRALRCSDFVESLRSLSHGRRVFHKPHPFSLDHAEEERALLQDITGVEVNKCRLNAYQILSSHDDVEIVGISSGLLQEAPWFNKPAHTLFRPFVPLAIPGLTDEAAYQQIHFQTFLSPSFWHQLLAPELPEPKLLKLPTLAHHHARETLDQWWDYSKVITWERALPYEAFMRGGGAELRNRVDDISVVGSRKVDQSRLNLVLGSLSSAWTDCVNEITLSLKSQPQEFDRGELYQAHEAWGVPGQRPTLQRIDKYKLNDWLKPNTVVLDIGCNIGMFGLQISPKISKYYGIDNNPLLINYAKRLAKIRNIDNCHFECADFKDFAASGVKGSFDILLSFAVHTWISSPLDEYAKLLKNLLRPGGILILESNRLDTNDKDFFCNIIHFINVGFTVIYSGSLKDDGVIERGFYVFENSIGS